MKKRLPHLAVFLAVAVAYTAGGLAPLERLLMDLRFNLLKRPASGDLVVVEIDSRSLQRLDVWPWPRRFHADLLERLFDAGAREVAFDIDFSSRSNPADDRRFEHALERYAGRVVLPVFKQHATRGERNPQLTHSAPLAAFAGHARLASVNVRPETDGLIRRSATVVPWREAEIPSMAAVLAGPDRDRPGVFHIDFGIRPETVPRLSYVDVLHGRFERSRVAGKLVMVGGTAVELGDQHAVPVHAVVSGPILRALAFESLVQRRAIARSAPLPVLAVALLLAWFLGPRLSDWPWRRGLAGAVGCALVGVLLSVALQARLPLSLDIVPWMLVPPGSFLFSQLLKLDQQALSIFRHRMSGLQRQAMMKCVVNDSFDGIVITDQGGAIELFNPAASDMLGYEADEMIGRPIDDLMPRPEGFETLTGDDSGAAINTVKVNMIGPLEITVSRRDGTPLVAELVVSSSTLNLDRRSPHRFGFDRDVFIYTFRDIGERKKAEEALLAAKTQAEFANRAKSEFLANMSHELRTPLNAVLGFSEIIKTETLGPVGVEAYRDYAADIHNSGQHLLDVINDILDMSKIEAGEMTLVEETIDLPEVVASCLRLVNERAVKAGVRIASERPRSLPLLFADKRKVKQILLNLLSNAVKFTPQNGRILVRSEVRPDGRVALSVSDTGIGIAARDLAVVLDPFGQADSSLAREYEGTGLGLPLVKMMVELHGGTFELESAVGRGTTATVLFPPRRVIEGDNVTRLAVREAAVAD